LPLGTASQDVNAFTLDAVPQIPAWSARTAKALERGSADQNLEMHSETRPNRLGNFLLSCANGLDAVTRSDESKIDITVTCYLTASNTSKDSRLGDGQFAPLQLLGDQ